VLTFWIDGVQQDNFTTVDNDTRRVDFAQLGSISGIDTGTRGTLYFDAFESRRTTYIGPMAGLLSNDRLAFLPTLGQIQAWVDSVFAPLPAMAATEPVPTPDYDQSMAQSTPVAPVAAQTARDAGIGHVLAMPIPVPVSDWAAAPLEGLVSRSITYGYDDLYRLKTATYNDGTSFAYTYDAVGNRLTETTTGGLAITYIYDNANRLTSMDGITYGWDNNGNLLSDGVSSYTYYIANRLKTLTQGTTTYTNMYNGQGDRLRQTVNGVTTTFVMDLNSGLTQALSDGTYDYIYGKGRIAQVDMATQATEYFLGDALGSVRQLTDSAGAVTFAQGYAPYGTVATTSGSGATSYGFTNEYQDTYIKLIVRLRSTLDINPIYFSINNPPAEIREPVVQGIPDADKNEAGHIVRFGDPQLNKVAPQARFIHPQPPVVPHPHPQPEMEHGQIVLLARPDFFKQSGRENLVQFADAVLHVSWDIHPCRGVGITGRIQRVIAHGFSLESSRSPSSCALGQ
jgi:YD repeat-containing protein